jgi:hypothetical protein
VKNKPFILTDGTQTYAGLMTTIRSVYGDGPIEDFVMQNYKVTAIPKRVGSIFIHSPEGLPTHFLEVPLGSHVLIQSCEFEARIKVETFWGWLTKRKDR